VPALQSAACLQQPWAPDVPRRVVRLQLASWDELAQHVAAAGGAPTAFVISAAGGGSLTASKPLTISTPGVVITSHASLLPGSSAAAPGAGRTALLEVACAPDAGSALRVSGTAAQLHGLSFTGCGSSAVVARDASLWLNHCSFSDNSAGSGRGGGALAAHNSRVYISDSSFARNSASGSIGGGALYIDGAPTAAQGSSSCWAADQAAHISDSSFQANAARFGGALHVEGASLRLDACKGSGNQASATGGFLFANTSSSIVVTGSRVTANVAALLGGAFAARAGSSLSIEASTVSSNTAGTGAGGVYTAASSLRTEGSTFSNNLAKRDGGALYCAGGCTWRLSGTTLDTNSAQTGHGGAMFAWGASVTLEGVDMLHNSAGLLGGGASFANTSVSVTGGMLRGNTAPGSDGAGGALYMQGCRAARLQQVHLHDNAATWGGAVYATNGSIAIQGCQLVNSTATSAGGALYLRSTPANITYTKFTLNVVRACAPGTPSPPPGSPAGGLPAWLAAE
jgi:predicted outer membrane repeat protein